MTNQEIFDKVYRHLLTQNAKSMRFGLRNGKQCAYRGDDGLKCAIGCLIPDDKYDPIIEGAAPCFIAGFKDASINALAEILISVGIETRDFIFVRRLQYIHDSVSPERWRDALAAYADEKGLAIPNILITN